MRRRTDQALPRTFPWRVRLEPGHTLGFCTCTFVLSSQAQGSLWVRSILRWSRICCLAWCSLCFGVVLHIVYHKGAWSGNRTRTANRREILSLLCLPVPPPKRVWIKVCEASIRPPTCLPARLIGHKDNPWPKPLPCLYGTTRSLLRHPTQASACYRPRLQRRSSSCRTPTL